MRAQRCRVEKTNWREGNATAELIEGGGRRRFHSFWKIATPLIALLVLAKIYWRKFK